MPPRISIVIPAYNEEKYLPATLAAIRKAIAVYGREDAVEIVVTDNASTDRTAEIAERGGATVVFEPHRQIARSRNVGARQATGDYLIFTDADTLLHRGIVKRIDELLSGGRVIGGGAFVTYDDYWDARLIARLINYGSLLANKSWGAFLFCERESFEAIGGFDESLYGLEEIFFSKELTKRGKKAGKKFKVISDLTNVTSARRLGARREVLATRLPFLWGFRRNMKDRKACGPIWYDVER